MAAKMGDILIIEGKREAVGVLRKKPHSSWRMCHPVTCSASHLPQETFGASPSKQDDIKTPIWELKPDKEKKN